MTRVTTESIDKHEYKLQIAERRMKESGGKT